MPLPRRAPQGSNPCLPIPEQLWDATRTYPQIVVLIEYADTVFSMPDPQAFYNDVFNTPEFNDGAGPGCAAEYMLSQSLGMFHVRFDIFGPYKISMSAKQATDATNHGHQAKAEVLQALFADKPDLDYSIYDWNGDGTIEQVVYVCAGPNGNEGNSGFIWPNTSSAPLNMITPDGLAISRHSITPEGTHTSKSHPGTRVDYMACGF